MDIGKWIGQAKELGYGALSKTTDALGAGVGFVRSQIGTSWLFGSTESSRCYDSDRTDEKHYFLIPDRRSDVGYSLYSMRCLPEGVPPINDLPKHRVFHLPNQHAMPTVEHILVADARKSASNQEQSPNAIGSRLNDLADQIDKLDGKVFGGVLLIGGLVALINPVAGAVVAAKALIPSMGILLSKYGLKYAGDTANERDLSSRIKKAEKDVLRQFRGAETESIVNPLLAQLDRALETTEGDYDPIMEFDADAITFGERDRRRFMTLTCQAISNTYKNAIDDRAAWEKARLGPEDIRYLKLLRDISDSDA